MVDEVYAIIKFGGSVITDKKTYLTPRKDVIHRLCKEIHEFITKRDKSIILIHGAGSFGHILAKEGRLDKGISTLDTQIPYVSRVQRDVRLLHMMVLDAMIDIGLKPFSIPAATISEKNEKGIYIDFRSFHHALVSGMIPVSFGDVVPDRKLLWSILSGDILVLELAKRFRPQKVAFIMDVDGIYKHYPNVKYEDLITTLSQKDFYNLHFSTAMKDVTGSIKGKLECCFEIRSYTNEVVLINGLVPRRLYEALDSQTVGTYISP